MKKLFLVAAVLFSGVSAVFAQTDKADIELFQSVWGKDKQEIVKYYMKFTPEEASVFWPVYDAYDAERKKLGSERFQIIKDYADNYANLTPEKADELVNRVFANNVAVEKLNKTYYAKAKKVISPVRAAQWMQVESYLQTMIRSEIQESLPFIGEIKK